MQSSSSRTAKRFFANNQLIAPTPYHLRSLVLDYLCHHCHTATAKAFVKDSTIRHLDADGDEIMQPEKRLSDTPAELDDQVVRQVELRERIQTAILSGRVDDATALLNEHFPTVLSESTKTDTTNPTPAEQHNSPDNWQYVAPTSVDPTHLSLNLRILAFVEACRTIPLPYTSPKSASSSSHTPPVEDSPPESASQQQQSDPSISLKNRSDPEVQTELLAKAQKLHAAVSMLQKPSEIAIFHQELSNVCGLLAYKVPEESPTALYLSQERREAVADQINRAILYRMGRPAVSHLELYVRYTSTLWNFLHEFGVKAPTLASRPAGVKLPPTAISGKSGSSSSSKNAEEILPPFDLHHFLDFKS